MLFLLLERATGTATGVVNGGPGPTIRCYHDTGTPAHHSSTHHHRYHHDIASDRYHHNTDSDWYHHIRLGQHMYCNNIVFCIYHTHIPHKLTPSTQELKLTNGCGIFFTMPTLLLVYLTSCGYSIEWPKQFLHSRTINTTPTISLYTIIL